MKVLNNKQVDQKISRLCYQILENNVEVRNLIFLGINKNGYAFAKLIKEKYDSISDKESILGKITLDPAKPNGEVIDLEVETKNLNGKNIIVVDDVANTGRTIFYAIKPLLDFLPKKIEAAVLVDRKHKKFPILIDYVGLSLATTLKDNIKVDIKKENSKAAFLL